MSNFAQCRVADSRRLRARSRAAGGGAEPVGSIRGPVVGRRGRIRVAAPRPALVVGAAPRQSGRGPQNLRHRL